MKKVILSSALLQFNAQGIIVKSTKTNYFSESGDSLITMKLREKLEQNKTDLKDKAEEWHAGFEYISCKLFKYDRSQHKQSVPAFDNLDFFPIYEELEGCDYFNIIATPKGFLSAAELNTFSKEIEDKLIGIANSHEVAIDEELPGVRWELEYSERYGFFFYAGIVIFK